MNSNTEYITRRTNSRVKHKHLTLSEARKFGTKLLSTKRNKLSNIHHSKTAISSPINCDNYLQIPQNSTMENIICRESSTSNNLDNRDNEHQNNRYSSSLLNKKSLFMILTLFILSYCAEFSYGQRVTQYHPQPVNDAQYQKLIDSFPVSYQINSEYLQENNKNEFEDDSTTTTTPSTTNNASDDVHDSSTTSEATTTSKLNDKTCLSTQCIQAAGYISLSMDTKQNKPCDNFYQYVCGKWVQDHPFPANLKSWSHFQRVYFSIREDLIKQMTNKDNVPPEHFKKLFEFFRGCVNTKQREATGYDRLFTLFEQIGGWPMLDAMEQFDDASTTTVPSDDQQYDSDERSIFDTKNENKFSAQTYSWENAYLTLAKKLNIFYFVGVEMTVDLLDTTKTIIKIGPPYKTNENVVNLRRTNLKPNRKVDSADYEEALERYTPLVRKLRKVKGLPETYPELEDDLEELFDLQFDIQNMTSTVDPPTAEKYRDNLKSAEQIRRELGAHFDLMGLVEKIYDRKISNETMILVPDMNYLQKLSVLLSNIDRKILANYFGMNMAMTLSPHTTPDMVELLVVNISEPHTENVLPNICFEETAVFLPEMLGALFLSNQFANDTQWADGLKHIDELLREAFEIRLNESRWMDDQTRAEALQKLGRMGINIGHPDWYGNDTYLAEFATMFENIDENDYFKSVLIAAEVSQSYILKEQSIRFNDGNQQPGSGHIPHHETFPTWPNHRAIIDINAFYYFTTNAVYIPAVLMQYPFYMKELPKSILFGSIGMIIGHEMTHAFDNSGRLYDKSGALRNWWSNATIDKFSERTDCFVNQYNNLTFQSVKMNGEQTLAENIADNGGLQEAYRAFKLYTEKFGDSASELLPGELNTYTPEQLFFISFANMWCTNILPEATEQDVKWNVHSPAPIRVLGSLANFPEFSKAFNCPLGSPMNPVQKCLLW